MSSRREPVATDPCPAINPRRTALIIPDMQNDALDERGACALHIRWIVVPGASTTLPNIELLGTTKKKTPLSH
jgi:hypothetical protein